MPQKKKFVGAATDRTVAQLLRGESSVPISQLNPEQRLQFERAKAKDQQSKGIITPEQSAQRIAKAQRTWEIEQQQRTIDTARRKGVSAKSEAIKQETIRDVAARYGVGVGTISKDGTAQVSNRSRTAANVNVVAFREQPKQNRIQQSNVIKSEQPDQSLVSPYLTQNMEKNKVQGPVKQNYSYEVSLTENKRQTQPVIAPLSLTQYTDRKFIPQMQDYPKSYDPKTDNPMDFFRGFYEGGVLPLTKLILAPKPIVSDIFGRSEWEEKSLKKAFKKIDEVVPEGPTASGAVIQQALTGQPIRGTGEGIYYDAGSIGFDVASALLPTKGAIAKGLAPIKSAKYEQAGVTILTTPKTFSRATIKAPGVEVKPKSVIVGYGTKTKPIISKVGDKITLGGPDLSGVTSVKISAETGKQTQRGVKLAADSSKYEQQINKQLLPKVQGLSRDSVSRGKTIEEIIDITTSKKKDTKTAESLPEEFFSSVTKTEQPSFVGALTKAQKKTFNPIGKYEGSVSQAYFVLPRFMRQAGDVDLHASTYGKAAKQIDYITPKIKADPDREFYSITNPKTKSAKTFVKDSKGKSEKVIEILNPEEVDEKGISQTIEGTTLFGKKIPSTSYSVTEGKTYGRQRQILKKGESLYSIQQTKTGLSLEPAPFRKEKDVADFYALAKSAQEVEFPKGSKEYERLDVLLNKFKSQQDFDVEEYLRKNKATPERVTISTDKSLLQRAGSIASPGTIKTSIGSTPSLTSSLTRSPAPSISGRRSSSSIQSITNRPKSLTGKSLTNSIQSTILSRPSTPSITGKSVSGKSLIGKSLTGKSSTSTGSSTGKSLGTPRGGGVKSLSQTRVSLTPRQQTMMEIRKKPAAPLIILTKDKTKKTKGFRDRDHNFLGNTRVAEVSGFRTKKTDLTVGDKKTKKLYDQDVLSTKRKYKKSDRSGSKSLLGKSNRKMLGI